MKEDDLFTLLGNVADGDDENGRSGKELAPRISLENIAGMLGGDEAFEELYQRSLQTMWSLVEFGEMETEYSCAIKEVRTKFEILDAEFSAMYKRNPISSISTRLKSRDSILGKMLRKKCSLTVENAKKYLNDIAGVRVVCKYIDDIYNLADALLKQDDVTLLSKKDYIEQPKPNGYRSLHLIISVPVYFSTGKIKVEVQIRTIAMDFWASLEHQIKYKQEIPDQERVIAELTDCAEVIAKTDQRMMTLRKHIEDVGDEPTEEDELFSRLKQMLSNR